MIDFRKPTLEDKEWIKQKTAEMGCPSCEYTFGNIFSYTAKMDIEVAEIFDCFVTRCIFDGQLMYCYPMGNGDKKKALTIVRIIIISLPPLPEQKRIVAKLEELLPLCERLK